MRKTDHDMRPVRGGWKVMIVVALVSIVIGTIYVLGFRVREQTSEPGVAPILNGIQSSGPL